MNTLLLQSHDAGNADLYTLTLPNHAEYATRYGYDMLQRYVPFQPGSYWEFIEPLRRLLLLYDTVLTVGSDVIFTNMSMTVEDVIGDVTQNVLVSLEDIGGSAVNAEMIIWRRGPGATAVLDKLIGYRDELFNHPWGAQEAFNRMLAERDRDICFLPPRMLQSSPVRTFQNSAWKPGDFALHFLAMSNADKFNRCSHFLQTGEVLWRD